MKKGDIKEKIRAFLGNPVDKLNRYRSWEHCYGYFHRTTPEAIAANRDHAALQLGFYLASWECTADRVSFLSMITRCICA
jgi:hypothetical protein